MRHQVTLLTVLPVFALIGCGSSVTPTGGSKTEGSAEVVVDPVNPEAKKRLQEIGQAMHISGTSKGLPAGIYSKNKPGLSWRVQILPALGEKELYKQFKLDEPWDSEHNKALIPKMPKVFESPVNPAPAGQTYLRSFAGPHTYIPGGEGFQPKLIPISGTDGAFLIGRSFVDGFFDGTSNTLMAAEAAEPVVWTKPDELTYDGGPKNPTAPLPKLGGPFKDGCHALLVDGSVLFLPKGCPDELLRVLLTADGGESVDYAPLRKANPSNTSLNPPKDWTPATLGGK